MSPVHALDEEIGVDTVPVRWKHGAAKMVRSVLMEEALSDVLQGISESLRKEGADIAVTVDEGSRTIHLKLVRNRIVCEGCLLPAEMAERRVRRRLALSGETARYGVETDWS